MSSLWQTVVIVVALVIADFLCISSATTTFSTNTQSNVWLVRQNSTNKSNSATWQGAPTTPWPTLGARRPQNRPQTQNTPNLNLENTQNSNSNAGNNRNAGIGLSYGTNPSQNKPIIKGSSGNVGVDLSYGLNTNQNQNNMRTNQMSHSMTSNQNVNYARVAQNNPTPNLNRGLSKSAPNLAMQSTNMQGSTLTRSNSDTQSLNPDDELREFSETLLKKDVNNAAKYVTINYQGKTTSRSMKDEAPEPLLSIKKEAYEIPSIVNLLSLYDNYVLETNVNEHVSAQEKIEENTLLDTLLSTSVMQHTRNFLVQKGAIPRDPKAFRDKIKEIWFNMYSRGQGRIGSSGFEHVFLAELKNNDVSGLHNWLYFHDAEAKKSANYLGYLKKFEIGNNKGAILKYHFTLAGKDKPVGSMFIGTSPELEIALYTTCFMLRADQVCPLKFSGKNFIIRTYTFRYRGKNMIGSAFPEI